MSVGEARGNNPTPTCSNIAHNWTYPRLCILKPHIKLYQKFNKINLLSYTCQLSSLIYMAFTHLRTPMRGCSYEPVKKVYTNFDKIPFIMVMVNCSCQTDERWKSRWKMDDEWMENQWTDGLTIAKQRSDVFPQNRLCWFHQPSYKSSSSTTSWCVDGANSAEG